MADGITGERIAERRVLPYGSWPSPITIEMAEAAQLRFREPRFFGSRGVCWTESRPAEGGRQVIVRWSPNGATLDITPEPFNARTMAHEYGGGWYTVDSARDVVYFSNLPDGRIYRKSSSEAPEPVTVEGPYRYADLTFDWTQDRIVCVREDHTGLDHAAATDGARIPEPRNELVAVDISSGDVTVLASGYDFYSSPRPAYDGLAWLQWHHPNMPWDSNELWVADIDDAGQQSNERMIAGGPDESIVQPTWAPGGSLIFASDRTGWWNLYRWTPRGGVKALTAMEAEFAGPQWVFGMRWYGVAEDGTIYAAATPGANGVWRIAPKGKPEWLELPDERIESLDVGALEREGPTALLYIGGSWREPRSIVLVELTPDGAKVASRRVLRSQFELEFNASYLARPELISFPTTDGGVAYANYYAPTNPDVVGPSTEKPPLIVETHGGPTSSSSTVLQMSINAFTSRGFAYVDVDYRGSTGHGRAYMRELYGKWGIYDVDDAIAAARFLVERGDVDPDRLTIRGSSAGGYTTLAALVFHPEVFAAGASHYGVGDLEALSRFTHKLESHYLDQLVAPYPEGLELLHERSPIYHVERLSRPLIVLQGKDDMVVPIAQAEQIVEALRKQHIPYAYLAFDGEGHGFRQAKNIRRSLEAELSFYAQVFDYDLADAMEAVKVECLADKRGY
jgi:dipeptidyl aminopeptidase/acylaminoacyl peptidase